MLEHPDFCQWRDNPGQRLLWVKGDPGKGKTMLLCGIIDHVQTKPAEGRRLAYFFCQATDGRINNATAVLRGLIFMLLDQDPSLVSYMKREYDIAGKALFEDTNGWQALSEVFTNMLHDPRLQGVYLVVDALDECVAGLGQLLDLIAHTPQSTSAKWLVSSRNWPQIEEQLCSVAQRLSLELNAESVSAAVDNYIVFKVSQLRKQKGYRENIADEVRQYLLLNADGTFLWVALVCQELEKAKRWNALQKVKSFPAGLDALYDRMMRHICGPDTAESWDADTAELCKQVLAFVATTYRPPSLAESTTFIDEFCEVEDVQSLWDIINLCGSFLTVREDTIYFVHQSAKDFLIDKQSSILFPHSQAALHSHIATTSIEAMSQTLKRDIYDLCDLGFYIGDITRPTPDPLAKIRYSCLYWVHHLLDSDIDLDTNDDMHDGGTIDKFLQDTCLYWIESLSLQGSLSEGIRAIERLKQYLQVST